MGSRPGRPRLAGVLLIGGAALAGCAQKASASPSLQIGTAYVEVPSIRGRHRGLPGDPNNGSADRLTSARTSVGGHVTFRMPVRAGGTA